MLAVTALLFAAGTLVQAVRIGHSGATATWSHVTAATQSPSSGNDKV